MRGEQIRGRETLHPPQDREFVHGDGGQFAGVALQDDHVAVHFVVVLAAEVQAVAAAFAADYGADRFRGPALQADYDFVGDFDAVARLQSVNRSREAASAWVIGNVGTVSMCRSLW